jgi:hypothetical protein
MVGTVVAKVGGALIGDITGNKELGNIIGAIGGAYAGGMAGGFMSPASSGVTAATGAGEAAAFGAFDVADAANLAGSLGGGATATMNGAAAVQNIFGSTDLAGSTATTGASTGSFGGGTTGAAAGSTGATSGGGVFNSIMDYGKTSGGGLMMGNLVTGVAGGLAKQAELDAQKDMLQDKWNRDDNLSRVVSVQPMRLQARDENGNLVASKYY